MSEVILKNVTKKFSTRTLGEVTAVDDFNLTIREGECFSLLGPSGCGKTTTLRMIAGFEDLSDDERFIQLNRLAAAGTLAWTAEAQDPGMEGFREAMERPRVVAAQMFVTEGPEFDEAIAGAQAACADLGD